MESLYVLRLYKNIDFNVVVDQVISGAYLNKYLNKPILLRILKFFKLYESFLYVLENPEHEIVATEVIKSKE
jgi:hypothetical protein